MPLLAADSIGKSFGSQRILTSARLEAHGGAVTFVAGRNGAGKSTLLRILAGVVRPDYGIIKFAGQVFEHPSLSRLARLGLFYLPDRGVLAPTVRLRRQLEALALRFGGRSVDHCAAVCGISALLDAEPRDFSTGELRRAEVCLAMVRSPLCLIADEPLRGIDPKDVEALLEQFRSMARDGCAVVVSGHDAPSLLSAVDSVVWVTAGTTYSLGTPVEARASDRFRKEYLSGSWA